MKRLLLLLLCVSSFHMFSQNAPIDFETPGMGSNWTWNVFENDGTHVSIHLKDCNSSLYDTKTQKKTKNGVKLLYEAFLPKYILPVLKDYLKTIAPDKESIVK